MITGHRNARIATPNGTTPRANLRRARAALAILVVASAVPGLAAPTPRPKASHFVLVTKAEAAKADAPRGAQDLAVDRADGPRIEVLAPDLVRPNPAPVRIRIAFTPNGAAVDLASLSVEYVKFISLDLTDRVRPYVTESGIEIPDADLPRGKHTIRISLADVRKRLSVVTVRLTIV